MYRKQVRRRRAVLVALIVLSLILLSSHFSESQSGPLHTVQRGISAVLTPIGEGAERALKPARDLVNWFDETFEARGENEALRKENAQLREQAVEAESAVAENEQFEELLDFDRSAPAGGFEPVTARVIGRSPTIWFSTVSIDAGSGSGIERNDAVVSPDGLVGRIREVASNNAQVELITDPDSAVSARVPGGPTGILAPVAGDPEDLQLDFIDEDQEIAENDILVTAGWSNGVISSAYPREIPIGRVSETDTGELADFQRIQVTPFADLRQLDYVQVLTGGEDRPGVPG